MKFDRAQIIKALECCANNGECKECPINPHKGNYGYCTSLAINHALALISSQEQRIEAYRQELAEVRVALAEANKERQKLTDENERFNLLISEIEKEKQELFEDNKKLKAQRYRAYPDGRIEPIPSKEEIVEGKNERRN